jgi:hypothetical protein
MSRTTSLLTCTVRRKPFLPFVLTVRFIEQLLAPTMQGCSDELSLCNHHRLRPSLDRHYRDPLLSNSGINGGMHGLVYSRHPACYEPHDDEVQDAAEADIYGLLDENNGMGRRIKTGRS